MDKILEAFREIGKRAHEIISSEKGGKAVVGKNPLGQKSLAMDNFIEDAAASILKKNGIGKVLVTEEKGEIPLNSDAEGIVVLDPLDGSDNYSKDIPEYCMGISYSKSRFSEGITHSYVINLVSRDEYWAVKDKGAFRNGTGIRTSSNTDLSVCRLAIDYNNVTKNISGILPLIEQIKDFRRAGADILDMCYVASGGYEGFICVGGRLSVIHICGVKIIEEAGGIVTDAFGKKITPELKIDSHMNLVCSANKNMYDQIIKLLGVQK